MSMSVQEFEDELRVMRESAKEVFEAVNAYEQSGTRTELETITSRAGMVRTCANNLEAWNS